MTNEERFIQLKDSESVINIRIKDSNGNDTGEKIVFDLEDFDLPLNLNKSEAMHKRNRENLRNAFIILEKKEDRVLLMSKYILDTIRIMHPVHHRKGL